MSEWINLIYQRGPYKEFINQGWADKLGITLKSLNEYWAIFSQAGPGTLKYKDTISQFATDRINQKKKPAIVTHAEVLERISQLRRMTKSSAGGNPQMLDSMARELAKQEAQAAKYEADNSPSKAVPVAPEKAPLSEQEFGMIANELQGKTPEQSRDIIKNVMATVGDRLTPDQKAYAKKALKGLNDTIAQAQAAQKLPEPVVPVAPVVAPVEAAVPVAAPVSTQGVLPQPTGVNVSPIETVAPTVAPTAELGEQEVAIERFDTKGNYVEDTLTAVNAKKWADEKLDTLTKLLDCLKR